MNGLTIGEVARRTRVHIETLRYYERRGLVARHGARQITGYILNTPCGGGGGSLSVRRNSASP
jgi:hypothetical protein